MDVLVRWGESRGTRLFKSVEHFVTRHFLGELVALRQLVPRLRIKHGVFEGTQ